YKELEANKEKDVVIEAAIKNRLGIECCDVTITVAASFETVKCRLSEKYSPTLLEDIIRRQEDVIEEGIIIYNDGSYEELEKTLNSLWEDIKKMKK
ncbi:MAG: dephospho-CoA kinase, partial [Fervidobacterium sp.]